jgi:hypothetical protein
VGKAYFSQWILFEKEWKKKNHPIQGFFNEHQDMNDMSRFKKQQFHHRRVFANEHPTMNNCWEKWIVLSFEHIQSLI